MWTSIPVFSTYRLIYVHVTAEKRKSAYRQKLPPYFGFTASAKVVTAEKWKPPAAKKLPPYRVTAEKIPPYFGFTAWAKVVAAKNEKTANRLKITAVWQYRHAGVRLKNRYRRPPTDDHPGIIIM